MDDETKGLLERIATALESLDERFREVSRGEYGDIDGYVRTRSRE